VTDLASVNKAVASGMSLPPGVSPDLVVSIASSMGSKPGMFVFLSCFEVYRLVVIEICS
jgi:hypothetical protein